jgi:hypothetical protein
MEIKVFHINVDMGGEGFDGVLDARAIVSEIRDELEEANLADSTGSGGGMGAYDADFECYAYDLETCRKVALRVFREHELDAEQWQFTVDEDDDMEVNL